MTLNKKVTVLMPVYNSEDYLSETIESILNQSFTDFDFLIINDGSTDDTEKIIQSFKDERIIYNKNESNMGIVKTLNKGLQMIEGKYIVRIDSDDVAYPNRLEKQIFFMDSHKEVAVSGTSILKVYENGKEKKLSVNTDPKSIRTQLLFDNALMHPTTIIRNEVLKNNKFEYNEKYVAMEDYGLWQQISLKYDLGNINEPLLRYRVNEEGISQKAKKDKRKRDLAFITVYSQFFESVGIQLSEEELVQYRTFLSGNAKLFNSEYNKKLYSLLNKIKEELDWKIFDKDYFEMKLGQYFRINSFNNKLTIIQSAKIHNEIFKTLFPYRMLEKMKFLGKKISKE